MAYEGEKYSKLQENFYKENLNGTDWLGIIVKNDDPLFLGRCKVKIFEKFDELTDDLIPWAFPNQSSVFAGSNGYGSFSYPKLGTLVRVQFQSGDFYSPEYTIVENINKKMQGEIKESYENSQVIVYDEDEDLKIIYTKAKGVFVWLKGSFVNITPNGADIIEKSPHHYIDCPDVQVGTDASHPDTRCDELISLLTNMAKLIDMKNGAPIDPTTGKNASMMVAGARSSVCSDIVKIA